MPSLFQDAIIQIPSGDVRDGVPVIVNAALRQIDIGREAAVFAKVDSRSVQAAPTFGVVAVVAGTDEVSAFSTGEPACPSSSVTCAGGVLKRGTARPRCFLTSVFLKKLMSASSDEVVYLKDTRLERKP